MVPALPLLLPLLPMPVVLRVLRVLAVLMAQVPVDGQGLCRVPSLPVLIGEMEEGRRRP